MPSKRKPKPSPINVAPGAPPLADWEKLVVPKDPASYAAAAAVSADVPLRRLKHWVAKLAIAKHGSIAAAARKLGLTRGGLRYLLRTAKRR